MVLAAAALLTIAFVTYGRWLSFRVFTLREDATTPAVSMRDDRDYCPTKKSIVFGHHFTSIAGTGPIVGPAIAVMWGWLPAVLWVVFGAIFIGAVHDLGALAVSLKNKGRTVGDIAGDLLGPRVRTLFLTILIVALWIVLAIFGLVIAAVLRQYPGAIFPVMVQIPLALLIGLFIHTKGRSILLPSLLALALMYASVIWGDTGVLHTFNTFAAALPTWIWVLALLTYAYIASVLPVWTLLQPRDYINALQLVTALALLVAGLIAAAFLGGEPLVQDTERVPLKLVAPVMNLTPEGAPPLIPVLFITIACGAISGFHCLVSSGTTSKQLQKETHAHTVGYGSMLTESFLATLVIAACAAGVGFGITTTASIRGGTDFLSYSDGSGSSTLYETPLDHERVLQISSLERNIVPTHTNNLPKDEMHFFHYWQLRSFPSTTDRKTVGAMSPIYEETQVHDTHHQVGTAREMSAVLPEGQMRFREIWNIEPRQYPSISLTGELAFHNKYRSWSSAGSLGAKVSAFVDGAANLIAALAIPRPIALALMGVLVASFAGTTMDTACRLQRYVIQELARTFLPKPDGSTCPNCNYPRTGLPKNTPCPECGSESPSPRGRGVRGEGADTAYEPSKTTPTTKAQGLQSLGSRQASPLNPFRLLATTHGATLFAVLTAAALAFLPAPNQPWSLATAGSGGMLLWPLFGATNQLLAGLAFIVIAAWLIANKRPWWFIIPPSLLMLALPAWALTLQAFTGSDNLTPWTQSGQWTLVAVTIFMLAVEAWMIAELALRLRSGRLQNEKTADQGSEFSTGG